jgi:transaldolase
MTDVFLTLEHEGVEKFEKSWADLVATVEKALS